MKSIKNRYILVPQMKNYDQITADYEPYTIFFNRKSFKSNNVNTDRYGFRLNYLNGSFKSIYDFEQEDEVSLIIGGSTVFGFGSSADDKTISSYMTKNSDNIFLNFGATAFNSKQELYLFINNFKKFKKIKNVVLISGVNDLYLGINNEYENNFFFKDNYILANNLYKIRNNYYQRLLYFVYKSLFDKFIDPTKISLKDFIIKKKKNKFNDVINFNNIELNYDSIFSIWSSLSRYFEFNLLFCLQPMAGWLQKNLQEKERELFKLLDNSNNESHLKLKILSDISNYETFVKILKKTSNKYDLNFIDLNQDLNKDTKKDDWIFVDRVHLTDLGYEKISKLILNKI